VNTFKTTADVITLEVFQFSTAVFALNFDVNRTEVNSEIRRAKHLCKISSKSYLYFPRNHNKHKDKEGTNEQTNQQTNSRNDKPVGD